MVTIIFLVVLMIMTFVKLTVQGIFLIHKLQQLGYKNMKFIKWLEGRQFREVLMWNIFELLLPLFIILTLYFTIKPEKIPVYKYLTSSIMVIVFLWKLIHPFISGWVGPLSKKKNKKELVYTPRVVRLLFTHIILSIIAIVFIFYFSAIPIDTFTLSTWSFFRFNAFLLFVSLISPIALLASNIINMPIEKFVHYTYYSKAKKKLSKTNLVNIGITGSYGKTSTKFFVSTLLSVKYNTLHTPSSYNTPMGLSKVINSENLAGLEYFIAEMGADHNGEIATLCDLVKIKYGILTSIGLQHLETFGSIDNIIKTKFAILENVPEDGFGIYNYDSELIADNLDNFKIKAKIYGYSIVERNFSKVSIYADKVLHTRRGLEFCAYFWDGEILDVKTALLGGHNASNLLAAILFCRLLGMSLSDIKRGISRIKPVEHRLQLIDNGNGVLVLDDAFNANLTGATEALKVLNEIEGNKKIIVTPGLIDLGSKEDEHNMIFGQRIAKYADIAIIVGKERTKKIQEGVASENFDTENLYIVDSLDEAKGILSKIVALEDVVLFENDLPDTFSERI